MSRGCRVPLSLLILLTAALAAPAQNQGPGDILDGLLAPPDRPEAVQVEALASQEKVRPGDRFHVAVVVTPQPPFHINSHTPLDSDYVATVVDFEADGVTVESILYPPGVQQGEGAYRLDLYVDRTVIVATLTAPEALTGPTLTIRGKLTYQACKDLQCLPPAAEPVALSLPVAGVGETVAATHAELFAAATRAATAPATGQAAATRPAPAGQEGRGLFGWLEDLLTGGNVGVQLAAMFLLGLCLNLTGCTLPSLALTVGFFSNQAEGKITRQLALAIAFSVGMLLFFAVMGGISVGVGVGFSVIYQYQWTVGILVAVIVVFSGSLFGFYTLHPPKSVYKVSGGKAGLVGAFLMGLLAVILAIPCTAGFLVGILGYCANLGGNWVLIIGVWLLVGLGMCAPFILLALSPALTKRVPRAGDWTELIKKGFGFVLLIVAAHQASSLLPEGGFEVITGGIVFAWGAFIALNGWEKVKHPAGRGAALVIGALVVALAVFGLLLPNVGHKDVPHASFVDYSQQVMDQARSDGRCVLVKVTATWCPQCIKQERTTYRDPRVIAESNRPDGVLFVKADVSAWDSPASREIRRLDFGYPPMTLFYDAAGNEAAPRLPDYSTEQLLERIRSLRGGG